MNIRGEVIKTAIRWISKLYLFLNQGIKVKSLREKLTQTSTIGFYPNSVDKQYFVIWLVLTGGVVDLGGLGHPLAGLLEGLEVGGDATEEGRRREPIHQVLTLTCSFDFSHWEMLWPKINQKHDSNNLQIFFKASVLLYPSVIQRIRQI